MKRTLLTAPLALWLVLAVPQGALAAGGPVPPVLGSYVGVPGAPYRYATFDSGATTVVKRQEAATGRVSSELRVPGHYGIPGVDYSGSKTGLSADGDTLILAEVPGTGPPRTTRLLVLDTGPLAVRAKLTLPGWSTVDAISPDGRWLYLIHYPSSDISRYEVRAYDLATRRLLPKPVVDPRDRGEAMTGFAIDRVMSIGGRWAYTLYVRPSGVPFVHALDTTGRRAVCIDLPSLATADVGAGHLELLGGGTLLRVNASGLTHALIDTRTFKVSADGGSTAAAPVVPVPHGRQVRPGQNDNSWELIALLVAALGLVAAAGTGVARSRRHPGPTRADQGATVTVHHPRRTEAAPRAPREPAR